jgi:hypothetical protein
MDLAETLRDKGFRRWYERQLVESHAWLVTGFLSLIMCVIAIEVVAFRESVAGFVALMAVGGSGAAMCLYAWRRFTHQLGVAEHVASQATCGKCRTYGRLAFVSDSRNADAVLGCSVRVRCRGCGHVWSIA